MRSDVLVCRIESDNPDFCIRPFGAVRSHLGLVYPCINKVGIYLLTPLFSDFISEWGPDDFILSL